MNSPTPSGPCSPRSCPPTPPKARSRPTTARSNAILFRARTGIPWRDPTERYGPWETATGRQRRWSLDGTWQRITDRLRIDADTADELLASVGSTSARSPARRWGREKGDEARDEPARSTRTVPGRADHQDPSSRRLPPAPAGDGHQSGPARRLADVRIADGPSAPATQRRAQIPSPACRCGTQRPIPYPAPHRSRRTASAAPGLPTTAFSGRVMGCGSA